MGCCFIGLFTTPDSFIEPKYKSLEEFLIEIQTLGQTQGQIGLTGSFPTDSNIDSSRAYYFNVSEHFISGSKNEAIPLKRFPMIQTMGH